MYGSRECMAGRKRYKNNVNAISMNRIVNFSRFFSPERHSLMTSLHLSDFM